MSQESFGPVGMELCAPVCWQMDPEWVAQGCSSFLPALCKPLVPQVNVSHCPSFGFLKPPVEIHCDTAGINNLWCFC